MAFDPVIPEHSPRDHRRRARRRHAAALRVSRKPERGDLKLACDRRGRRRYRLPAANRTRVAAYQFGATRSSSSVCCRWRPHCSRSCVDGERPRPAFWLFSCLGSALVAGFAFGRQPCRFNHRRPADAGGDHSVWPRLCGGRQVVAQTRRLASDLMGAGPVAAGDAAAGTSITMPQELRRHRPARLARALDMFRCSAC